MYRTECYQCIFIFFFLNFIYFTTISKQVIQLYSINRARRHRCLRSDGLRVGGNRSTP